MSFFFNREASAPMILTYCNMPLTLKLGKLSTSFRQSCQFTLLINAFLFQVTVISISKCLSDQHEIIHPTHLAALFNHFLSHTMSCLEYNWGKEMLSLPTGLVGLFWHNCVKEMLDQYYKSSLKLCFVHSKNFLHSCDSWNVCFLLTILTHKQSRISMM